MSETTTLSAPPAEAVREALARICASEDMRASPQLIAFLGFVVERTLAGQQDRLKGYTIATEALGRDESFDPQIDPIVRVEATRLRRAIDRYYAGPGAADPVTIRMERGGYVPVFAFAECPSRPSIDAGAAPIAPPLAPLAPAMSLAARPWFKPAVVALVALAVAVIAYAVVEAPTNPGSLNAARPAATITQPAALQVDARARNIAERLAVAPPSVEVRAFSPIGRVREGGLDADALRERVKDALARFDDIRVLVGGTGSPAQPDFALSGWIDGSDPAGGSVSLRLVEVASGDVVWSRLFERVRTDDPGVEADLTRQIATTLAQPYGVIQTQVRARLVGAGFQSGRIVCLMTVFDYWRTYAPDRFEMARACLEQLAVADPGFASAQAALAQIYLEEWRLGMPARQGQQPALDRSLAAARRAVSLRPESARAHQALLDVHFHRREIAEALTAGERALALNPYDTDIVADYGARLVAIGRFEQGARFLRQAVAHNPGRPAWVDFFLFLAAYMRDDRANAVLYADLIRSDDYMLGLIARAIAAAEEGRAERAAELVRRIVVVEPAMARDPRVVLDRYFPREVIIDRLIEGLKRAGLGPGG